MNRLARVALVAVAAVVLLTACPPPITPHPPVVTPISQCKEVFPVGGPSGYTRPVPTNHPITILASLPDQRVILWLDRHCDRYYHGPYDPARPELWCKYRPDLGDRYYSEQDGFIDVIPQACPQAV